MEGGRSKREVFVSVRYLGKFFNIVKLKISNKSNGNRDEFKGITPSNLLMGLRLVTGKSTTLILLRDLTKYS